MDRQTSGWTDGYMNGWTDGVVDGWIERQRDTVSQLNCLNPECPAPAAQVTGSTQRDI